MNIEQVEEKLWEKSAEDLGFLYAEFLGKDYLIQEIIDNLKESDENLEALVGILEDMEEQTNE